MYTVMYMHRLLTEEANKSLGQDIQQLLCAATATYGHAGFNLWK